MVRDAVAYTQFQFLWRIISRGAVNYYWYLMIAVHGVLQMQ
jgi:hypothetical protein